MKLLINRIENCYHKFKENFSNLNYGLNKFTFNVDNISILDRLIAKAKLKQNLKIIKL